MKYEVLCKFRKDKKFAQQMTRVLNDDWGIEPSLGIITKDGLKAQVGVSGGQFTIQEVKSKPKS